MNLNATAGTLLTATLLSPLAARGTAAAGARLLGALIGMGGEGGGGTAGEPNSGPLGLSMDGVRRISYTRTADVAEGLVHGTYEVGHPYGVTLSASLSHEASPRMIADDLGTVWAVCLDDDRRAYDLEGYYFRGRPLPAPGDFITAYEPDSSTPLQCLVTAVVPRWEAEGYRMVSMKALRTGADLKAPLTTTGITLS